MSTCVWNVSKEDRLCKYCLLTHCDDRANRKHRRYGKVMPTIRHLDPGAEHVFEPEFYNACRTATSRLKENFGCLYVTRMAEDGVHVCRIK